jgi:hypothetical protein
MSKKLLSTLAKEKNVNGQFIEAKLTIDNQILIIESNTPDEDGPVEAVIVSPQLIFDLANKLQAQGDSEYWNDLILRHTESIEESQW